MSCFRGSAAACPARELLKYNFENNYILHMKVPWYFKKKLGSVPGMNADNTVNVLWFDCIIGLIKMTFLSNYKNVLKGGKCQRP